MVEKSCYIGCSGGKAPGGPVGSCHNCTTATRGTPGAHSHRAAQAAGVLGEGAGGEALELGTLVSSWGGCGGSRGMLRSTLTRQRQTDLERRVTSLEDLHLTVEATVSQLNGPGAKNYAPV